MVLRVTWKLTDDGRGRVCVMEGVEGLEWVFDSFDALPRWVADIIRTDGRWEGEFVSTAGE